MGILDFFGAIGDIISSIVDTVKNGFVNIKDAISNFFSIIGVLFNYIPSPFKEIFLMFLGIVTIIIAIRIVRSLMPIW